MRTKIDHTRTRLAVAMAGLGLAAVLVGPTPSASAESSAERTPAFETHPTGDRPVAVDGRLGKPPPAPSDQLVPNVCMIVPNVIGMTVAEATATVAGASPYFYSIVDAGGVEEGEAELGTIFFQSPAPGTLIYGCDYTPVGMTQVGFFIPE